MMSLIYLAKGRTIRKVMGGGGGGRVGDFWLPRIFLGLLPVQEFFFTAALCTNFFLIKSASCTICY